MTNDQFTQLHQRLDGIEQRLEEGYPGTVGTKPAAMQAKVEQLFQASAIALLTKPDIYSPARLNPLPNQRFHCWRWR